MAECVKDTVEHLIMHTDWNGPKAMHYEIYAAPKCHEFVTSVTSPEA